VWTAPEALIFPQSQFLSLDGSQQPIARAVAGQSEALRDLIPRNAGEQLAAALGVAQDLGTHVIGLEVDRFQRSSDNYSQAHVRNRPPRGPQHEQEIPLDW